MDVLWIENVFITHSDIIEPPEVCLDLNFCTVSTFFRVSLQLQTTANPIKNHCVFFISKKLFSLLVLFAHLCKFLFYYFSLYLSVFLCYCVRLMRVVLYTTVLYQVCGDNFTGRNLAYVSDSNTYTCVPGK